MTPFHLSFLVRDLDETRRFYADVLGCEIGRSSDSWVDFSLFGHQMSAHLRPDAAAAAATASSRCAADAPCRSRISASCF